MQPFPTPPSCSEKFFIFFYKYRQYKYLDYLHCTHSLQNTSTSTYLGRVGDSGTLNAGGDMGPAKYRENSVIYL